MTNIQQLSVAQLRQAIDIREQIEKLEAQLESLTSEGSPGKRGPGRPRGSRKLSVADKARISAGMKAKWAARKGKAPKKRKMSAAGRAAIAAAQKARWAKVKAGK
jgi:hypothetical protein